MSGPAATILAILALGLVLAVAVARPRGLPEVVTAAPVAAGLVLLGVVPAGDAAAEVRHLLPVVGFLAAMLLLSALSDDEGLFAAAGRLMAGASHGSPERLLVQVFAVAAAVTAALSLDATIVLLTPVVFATAARLGVRPRPHVYACTHLANSASLLLPVSNLTNLLAFGSSGLTFARFAGLMAFPWVVAIGTEYVLFRRFFARDLALGSGPVPDDAAPAPLPVVPVVVVVGTLAGFVLASAVGADPALAAVAGAAVLAVRGLARRTTTPRRVLGDLNLPFLGFVLALGVVVRAVVDHGLASAVGHLLPQGHSFPALLMVAVLAAVLANLVNNLPATLLLLPLVAPLGPGVVLAALIGVNVGPNLTYVGSLATLLWRRVLRAHDAEPRLAEFHALGALTVPAAIVLSTAALWVGLALTGGE
jgi:arsenical pump membrane protein